MKKVFEMMDVDEILRVYRKAILTNRTRLIVECLQRLEEVDHLQDWREALAYAEENLLTEWAKKYQAAKATQDEEGARRIEDEVMARAWSRPPTCAAAQDLIAMCRARKDAEEKAAREEAEKERQAAEEAARERARVIAEAAREKAAAEEKAAKEAAQKEEREKRAARRRKSCLWMLFLLALASVAAYVPTYYYEKYEVEMQRKSEAKARYLEKVEAERREYEEDVEEVLSELNKLKAQPYWWENKTSITGQIAHLAELANGRGKIPIILSTFSNDWRNAEASYQLRLKTRDELYARLTNLNARLIYELKDSSKELKREFFECQRNWADLKGAYARDQLKLSEEDLKADAEFAARCEEQDRIADVIRKLKTTRSAAEYLTLRNQLATEFSTFKFTKNIAPFPVTVEEVATFMKEGLPDWAAVRARRPPITEDEFHAFALSNILPLANAPFETAIYLIWQDGEVPGLSALDQLGPTNLPTKTAAPILLGLSCGKPNIQTIGESYSIEGKLYELTPKPIARERIWVSRTRPVTLTLHPACEEINRVIQMASSTNSTAEKFEAFLAELVDAHGTATSYARATKVVASSGFVPPDPNFFATRRVQLVARYLHWIRDDLRFITLPHDWLSNYIVTADKLAQPISIEGVPDELTWAMQNDPRVKEREEACQKFLYEVMASLFNDAYRCARRDNVKSQRLANLSLKFVGSLNCPSGEQWHKDPSKFFLSIFDESAKDGMPFYIIRKIAGEVHLVRVLEWSGTPRTIKVVNGMGKKLLAGDMLFKVMAGDKAVDLWSYTNSPREVNKVNKVTTKGDGDGRKE